MTWNYRIVFHDKDENPWYGLHEVYSSAPELPDGGRSDKPVSFLSRGDQGPEAIIEDLKMALADVTNLPLIKESEME